MSKKEAQARIKINKLLELAGWRFFPDAKGPDNIICEHRTTKKVYSPATEFGDDFEKAPDGFIDYLLLNLEKRPVAVVEAKRESIHPLEAKEQARDYAKSQGVRHIFLSNGQLHYYWDLTQGNPTRVSHFLSLEQLGEASRWNPDPQKLIEAKLDENYIAVSQDAGWLNYTPAQRETVRLDQNIKLLRDYQIAAAIALQKSYAKGNNRFLFEMATGTGKTLLSAAITKLFIRSANANRVLFLVDRLELESQAHRAFTHYLAKDGISTVIYKEQRDNWIKAQVVVTTIQSLSAGNRFLTQFSPNDFQLIISDEAHRTIGGNNRVIFDYFIGAKLGLTATPKDYLRGIEPDKMREDDPLQLELRLLLDTYKTFGCENGHPTFRFSLLDAVKHKPPYLVNPYAVDCRTDITTKLLSKQGWSVQLDTSEDDDEDEKTFYKRDFEKKFFSPATNKAFVHTFLANAKRDPLTGEIGKTIMFAVSRHHARKLTELLNTEIDKLHPGKYQSDFAVQVTSNVPHAQDMTKKFDSERNALNGKTRFNPKFTDYHSSRTRICVTVGMMTTGYDCEDLLNVVLARPIFSPTDFIQIKGRGTRLYTFKHKHDGQEVKAGKDNFYIFDFFANCEYFEKDFDYGKKIEPPKVGSGEGPGGGGGKLTTDFTWTGPDKMKMQEGKQVGLQGMKIDREAFSRSFEEKTREEVVKQPELQEAVESGDWARVEAFVRENIFDRPKEFWNTEKLREAYAIDRRLPLREILQKVFGVITRFPTRQDLATEDFERFLSVEGVDGSKVHELQTLFTAYLLYPDVRAAVDAGNFSQLATDARLNLKELKALGEPQRKLALNYIKDNIVINKYLAE
jgi:type I restriction enzyme R subunit